MTSPSAGAPRVTADVDDHELVGQADWVIGGDAGRKARRQAWYAGYVCVLAALAYGFPIIQGVVKTADPSALRTQLETPLAAGVLIAALGAVLWSARVAGGHRGPVVPPLPWIDHVVSSPIDRAVSTGRWWRLALGLSTFLGGLVGATLGAGVAFAGLTRWYAAGFATIAGALLGWVAALLWLSGEVRAWEGAGRGWLRWLRARAGLRELHIEVLRRHAANSSTIGGSVVAGNLRTARLELARPVRRARSVRLRAGRPFGVVVSRDLLGLRRQPSAWWSGLGLTVLGVVVIAWAVTHPVVPAVAMTIGLVPAYFGFGAWAEGLRLQADNAGTPSLLGIPARTEAVAHLVVPVASALVALVVGVGIAALGSGRLSVAAVVLVVAVAGVLAGGHLLSAFRGSPPASTFRADSSGPGLLIGWYVLPVLVVLVAGTVVAILARRGATEAGWALVLAALVVWWGLGRPQKLTEEHRI